MPTNKRESLIYSVLMCFIMVFWMSMYNVSLQMHGVSMQTVVDSWLGLPIAYIFAMCCDWFLVSHLAKGFAFKYLVSPDSSDIKKVLSISVCMVVPMVFIMSFYGACEACVHTGAWNQVGLIWLTNIPKNFIMALPFQLIIAGPLVRFVFRKAFPLGSIQ